MGLPAFLSRLFPPQERLIPDNNVTSDNWVIINSTSFNTQWIDCSYPISGGYGRGPRYLYYALVFIALVERRQTWVVGVALASVMTFSGAAAIHAIVLAAIRTQIAPQYMLENYEMVMVGNNSPDELWLPVLPMAWDADCDAVLAVVGVAFLVVTPMQTWSRTFQKSEGKAVLFLWSLLLLAGMICALVNEAYVTLWAFPQLRFCPLQQNDTLPLTNGGTTLVGGVWDRQNWYHWNETITRDFTNSTNGLPNICIYPCFDTSWPLRDRTEIIASISPNAVSSTTYYWLIFAVYIIVSTGGLSTLTIFIVKTNAQAWRLRSQSFDDLKNRWRNSFSPPHMLKNIGIALWATWLVVVNIYAKVLSTVSLVLFIGFIEWTIWYDNQGEDFRHIGQWGAVVAAVLVFISALVNYSWPKLKSWLRAWGIASLIMFTTVDYYHPRSRRTYNNGIKHSPTLGQPGSHHIGKGSEGKAGSDDTQERTIRNC